MYAWGARQFFIVHPLSNALAKDVKTGAPADAPVCMPIGYDTSRRTASQVPAIANTRP
jgi:hypothetical protein